jgi:DNA-binding Xre family transcriptional regulator
MNETKALVEALKRCLRSRAMTYRKLGQCVGLSESSVKRLFANRSFTLARLERICAALDMSVADLVRMTTSGTPQTRPHTLTLDQERTLAADPTLLAFFYLLLNGRTVDEAAQRLKINSRSARALLTRLVSARLVDADGRRGVRLNAKLPIAWRPEGPVRKLYERQVRAEFLQAGFNGASEMLAFHSAELSAASVRILLRKLDRLAADFADLAALDVSLPAREKTSVAMLLACRPWVFSMFSAYRSDAA